MSEKPPEAVCRELLADTRDAIRTVKKLWSQRRRMSKSSPSTLYSS